MTRAERLEKCARYLRLRIPEPAPPKRKAQKSFATLAAGQHLELLKPMQVGTKVYPAGTGFLVESPSNLGVVIRVISEAGRYTGIEMTMSDKEWKTSGLWKKVRRPSKKKLAQ